MSQFTKNLDLLIRSLEQGRDVKLSSGHTLLWSDEHDAPGFWYETYSPSSPEDGPSEGIMMIGHETTWMSLIAHARTITEKESIVLAANMALTEINRSRRG